MVNKEQVKGIRFTFNPQQKIHLLRFLAAFFCLRLFFRMDFLASLVCMLQKRLYSSFLIFF